MSGRDFQSEWASRALCRRDHGSAGEAARWVVHDVAPKAPGFMPLSLTPIWGLDYWVGQSIRMKAQLTPDNVLRAYANLKANGL